MTDHIKFLQLLNLKSVRVSSMVLSIHKKLQGGEPLLNWANNFDKGSPDSDTMLEYSIMIVKLGGGSYRVPIPCTAFSQSLSVNSLRWRIRGERAGNIFAWSTWPETFWQRRIMRPIDQARYMYTGHHCFQTLFCYLSWEEWNKRMFCFQEPISFWLAH